MTQSAPTQTEQRASAAAACKSHHDSPSLLSTATFSWIFDVLRKGWKKPLQQEDLPELPRQLSCATAYPKLVKGLLVLPDHDRKISRGNEEEQGLLSGHNNNGNANGSSSSSGWQHDEEGSVEGRVLSPEERLRSPQSFRKLLWQLHGRAFCQALLFICLYQTCIFCQPLILKHIINTLVSSHGHALPGNIYMYALLLFLAPVLGSLCKATCQSIIINLAITLRAQLTCAVYQKLLRLGSAVRQRLPSGRVVNLMSADVTKICDFIYPQLTNLLVAPLAITVSLVLLWFQIGWPTLVGFILLAITTPITNWCIRHVKKYRARMLGCSDQRIKLMAQFVTGVRVVKMYMWEGSQREEIEKTRSKELEALRAAIPARVAMQTIMYLLPQLAGVLTFVVVGLFNPSALAAGTVFSSLVLFQILRQPLQQGSMGLVEFGAAIISASRLTEFFALEEQLEYVQRPTALTTSQATKSNQHNDSAQHNTTSGIRVEDGSFQWAIHHGEQGQQQQQRQRQQTGPDGSARNKTKGHRLWSWLSYLSRGWHHKQHATAEIAGGDGSKKINLTDGGVISKGFCLSRINLKAQPGELVCVVGRVGSGKSSLVSAILGEMQHHGGMVSLAGRVAYGAQQPWIMNGTVVENVCMGARFDHARWDMVVQVCALSADLQLLPAGEYTEIGEKGVNLSGGQKARLSLARAVYQDADVYILDDPLSAVDVHVGRHIFQECIAGVLAAKAVLLVTNQVQYLPDATRILLLQDGCISVQGSYQECLQHTAFASMLEEFNSSAAAAAQSTDVATTEATSAASATEPTNLAISASSSVLAFTTFEAAAAAAAAAAINHEQPSVSKINIRQSSRSSSSIDIGSSSGAGGGGSSRLWPAGSTHRLTPSTDMVISIMPSTMPGDMVLAAGQQEEQQQNKGSPLQAAVPAAPAAAAAAAAAFSKGRIIVKEDRELGQVQWSVYATYARAFGVWVWGLMLLWWASEQGTRILANLVLAAWSKSEAGHQYSPEEGFHDSTIRFVVVYVCVTVAYGVAVFLRSFTINMGCFQASRSIFLCMLRALMRAKVAFFEATPVGRILSRASADTDAMDYNIGMAQMLFGNAIARLAATFAFLCAVQPSFIGVLVPLGIIYFSIQRYYRRSVIEVQRLESVSRSPVYANFSETMAGLDTLRAYQMQHKFVLRHESKVDCNSQALYIKNCANEWLALRLDAMGAAIVLAICTLNILYRNRVEPNLIGLALSEAIDLTNFLNMAVKASAIVETRYNAVERILAYTKLEPEASETMVPPPPATWPRTGELCFEGVCMRYRPELEPVLKGISFKVADGNKVGIVGRTGSGKSSLIVALFRIVEPYAGAISLDGLNLLHLGLRDVRTAIAAIPQEPVLFAGSVRSNLDPFTQFADAELWEVLCLVGLHSYVKDAGGLLSAVAEGGDNFSVGQRQLLCVARALLRKPQVLVADEATASVDVETDALMQGTIRRAFAGATVLTVAHRVNTILDSDKVLVLDQGRIQEYDDVPTLLSRPRGMFRGMVAGAGMLVP